MPLEQLLLLAAGLRLMPPQEAKDWVDQLIDNGYFVLHYHMGRSYVRIPELAHEPL
jgi:hypothetical protein